MIRLTDKVMMVVEKDGFKIGTEGQVIKRRNDNLLVAIGDKQIRLKTDQVIKVEED